MEKLADECESIWVGWAKCKLSNKDVAVLPELEPNDIWVDLWSPTCTSWTKRGSSRQWIDPSNIPRIALACGMRRSLCSVPHLLILECTPELELEWLEKLSGHRLAFKKVVLGPMDVGVPVTGERVWAASTSDGVSIHERFFLCRRSRSTYSNLSKWIRMFSCRHHRQT